MFLNQDMGKGNYSFNFADYMKDIIEKRSKGICELCAKTAIEIWSVQPFEENNPEHHIHICETCLGQLQETVELNVNHWRCLNDSMWSETKAVQVVAYRILHQIKDNGWPNDLLDMMYLDDDTLTWARHEMKAISEDKHIDCNGAVLNAGDSVVLIKDLKVKGGNFTAKRGTAVRNIRLVHDNPEHIEGKIDGQTIVILTQYVKK